MVSEASILWRPFVRLLNNIMLRDNYFVIVSIVRMLWKDNYFVRVSLWECSEGKITLSGCVYENALKGQLLCKGVFVRMLWRDNYFVRVWPDRPWGGRLQCPSCDNSCVGDTIFLALCADIFTFWMDYTWSFRVTCQVDVAMFNRKTFIEFMI